MSLMRNDWGGSQVDSTLIAGFNELKKLADGGEFDTMLASQLSCR